MAERLHTWFEFFAGGGMARLGLGVKWRCAYSNDWSEKKAAAYRANFGAAAHLTLGDVAEVRVEDLPGAPDLAWASFPCQDLSLAGNYAGLDGSRSGTFRPFWDLMMGLVRDGRKPAMIVLENVPGALTSHGGKDFETLIQSLADGGYRAGAMVVDAVHFVPQSRPRLFIIAVAEEIPILESLTRPDPSPRWHPRALTTAQSALPESLRHSWIYWNLPEPAPRKATLADLIEDDPAGVNWHSPEQTSRLIGMMSEVNRAKLRDAQRSPGRRIGTVYRRTRPVKDAAGVEVRTQRAEARFDGISGCLRTPAGGSSRQIILVVEGRSVRSRLLSPREAARLMGVPDAYPLPPNYNDAYHVFGDGLVVPVISWIERHLLCPLAER